MRYDVNDVKHILVDISALRGRIDTRLTANKSWDPCGHFGTKFVYITLQKVVENSIRNLQIFANSGILYHSNFQLLSTFSAASLVCLTTKYFTNSLYFLHAAEK